jgi:hypothetical protein
MPTRRDSRNHDTEPDRPATWVQQKYWTKVTSRIELTNHSDTQHTTRNELERLRREQQGEVETLAALLRLDSLIES